MNPESIVRAICDNPNDDALRLRYADYLESTGDRYDGLRAESIRVHCELIRRAAKKQEYSILSQRLDQLSVFFERWVDELPKLDGVRWNERNMDRGFVIEAGCDNDDSFLRHRDMLFSVAPIRILDFKRVTNPGKIVDYPGISRIRELRLNKVGISAEDVTTIANSPYLRNLVTLWLDNNSIGNAGAATIAGSPFLCNLLDLQLGRNAIGDEGVIALAASPILMSLLHIGLAENPITDRGAFALASSPYLNSLTAGLTLWGCSKVGPKGAAALEKRFGDFASLQGD